jgi:ubiquinone/menaquinone biosynthesis C-methylase UbiE
MKSAFIVILAIFQLILTSAQLKMPEKSAQQNKQEILKLKIMNFLDLKPSDKIVDIGSGNGKNILLIANFYPSLFFNIQDIDSTSCNSKVYEQEILKSRYFTNIRNFKFHYGNEKSTLLPSASFSKVIMFDLIHELTYKTEMFSDFKRILTKDGCLFVSEIIVVNKAPLEKGCNYPFMTEDELKATFKKFKFKIIQLEVFLKLTPNKYALLIKAVPE